MLFTTVLPPSVYRVRHQGTIETTQAVRRLRRNKKFELMLTRRAKAYSSSGSVVNYRSTNWGRHRLTSFQSKRVTNYATPPTPVPWRHLVNDIDLRSPKSLKCLTPACVGLHRDRDLDCWNLRSRSFQVIDVDKFKKPVTSACYDKQHVCAHLQSCSRYTR